MPFALSASSWQNVLGSVGLRLDGVGQVGGIRILEGDSEEGRSLGFRPTATRVRVLSVEDLLRPDVEIVWERPAETAVFEVPPRATVFARERWTGAPLVAGFRCVEGAVLWAALPPGERGFERFPFLMHALGRLGVEPPFRSNRLWAFFDSSYRARADTDYLASRWRRAGIRGLHVAAWHHFDTDPERDQYLLRLIGSCHRNGILVYAWLELPHVSENFWADHPEWREKTALLQDAQLDWRKLMNLANDACFNAVSAGVKTLLARFDWDGVNLAELYFESLQGHENPARFTPMNEDIRREFRGREGFDPIELFDPSSPRRLASNPTGLRRFLDYRAGLARRMQEQWLGWLEAVRSEKPDLDLVLTHVDDRLDTRMRDAVGADAGSVLPLLGRYRLTFLVEDPATVWNLGPERYREIAARYAALTPHRERLAIDLNIVQRYQDVYPTKQQAGTELFQLVNQAARGFPRVALYFEHSIHASDVPWVSSAAAAVERWQREGERYVVESPSGAGVRWHGPARVDGELWPVVEGDTVWLPAGRHAIEPAPAEPALRLLDLTGDLVSAASFPTAVEFAYRSTARVFAVVNKRPAAVFVDGQPVRPELQDSPLGAMLLLPNGQHRIRVDAPGN